MTARPARMGDVFQIVEVLKHAYAGSRYVGHVNVDEAVARKTIAAMIQRNGGAFDGSTFVHVIETDGMVSAFIAATLYRVYLVGDMLVAQDTFLCANDAAPPLATRTLLSAMLDWADGNSNVFEVNLTWSDALPTGERMDPIFRAYGFEPCGGVFRRHPDSQRKAA